MAGKIVRVLRVVEYEGPEDWVREQVAKSIHGTRVFGPNEERRIRAATLSGVEEMPAYVIDGIHKLLDAGPTVRAYPGCFLQGKEGARADGQD